MTTLFRATHAAVLLSFYASIRCQRVSETENRWRVLLPGGRTILIVSGATVEVMAEKRIPAQWQAALKEWSEER